MRTLSMAGAICLVAFSLSAGSPPVEISGAPHFFERLEASPPGLQEMMAKLRQQRTGSPSGRDAGSAVLIPLVVYESFPSLHAYYTAEYTLVLPKLRGRSEQRVAEYWIPVAPGQRGNPRAHRYTGSPVKVVEAEEIGWAGYQGLGAALFVALDDSDEPDSSATISANSRLSHWRGVALGEVSVSVPGIDAARLLTGPEARIYGIRTDPGYSTYYGLVNLSDADLTLDIAGDPHLGAWAEHIGRVTVPAGTMTFQRILNPGRYEVIGIHRAPQLITDNPATWAAFTITTDDSSGDGWFSMASAVPFFGPVYSRAATTQTSPQKEEPSCETRP